MIRILLVDDHGIVREGMRAVIGQEEDLQIIGEAVDGKEAIEKSIALRPDIVIVDLLMPQISGYEVISAIKKSIPPQKFIVLSSVSDPNKIRSAITLGISGYLSKNSNPETLIEVIHKIYQGEIYIEPEVSRKVILNQAESAPDAIGEMSDREKEILCLVAKGLSNDEISELLFISSRTVGVHVTHILNKLGLNNRTQAAIFAYKKGLVDI